MKTGRTGPPRRTAARSAGLSASRRSWRNHTMELPAALIAGRVPPARLNPSPLESNSLDTAHQRLLAARLAGEPEEREHLTASDFNGQPGRIGKREADRRCGGSHTAAPLPTADASKVPESG